MPFDDWIAANPAKKPIALKNMFEVLEGVFSKGPPNVRNPIVHVLLLQALTHASPDLIQNLIAVVKDQLIEIVHTREGACAAIICITNASVKVSSYRT
jgi:pumilio family protein 6